MKKIVTLLLSFLFILITLTSCKNDESIINYTLTNEPITLDPQIAEDISSKTVIRNMFEGLCKLDENGNAIPGVAYDWTSNEDYTSYTFNLRNDAKYSDGKTFVRAEDFVYALQRVVNPLTGLNSADKFYCIKNAKNIHDGKLEISNLGIKANDFYTLQINLEFSNPKLPELMASTNAMPCNKEFFDNSKGQYGLEYNYILNNGPFEFKNKNSWEHGKTLKLTKSNSYKGENKCLPSGILFSIDNTVDDTYEALIQGKTDAITNISSNKVNDSINKNMNISSFEDTTWGICFNMNNEFFKNENVRLGFLKSLEKEKILKDIPDNYHIANQIIPHITELYGNNYRELAGSVDCLQYSDDAYNLFNEGLNQVIKENPNIKKLPNISITCADDANTKKIVGNIIEVWNNKLENYFNINPVKESELDNIIKTNNYQIILTNIRAQSQGPYNILSLFSSSNKNNPCALNDIKYDEIINNIKNNQYINNIKNYIQAEKYLNDHTFFYPLHYEDRYNFTPSNIKGVIFYSFNEGIDFMNTIKKK